MAHGGSGCGRRAAFQRRLPCGQAVGILLAALAAASTASTVSGAVTKTASAAAAEVAASAATGLAESVPMTLVGGVSSQLSRQQEQPNESEDVVERLRRVYCRHFPAGRGCAEPSQLELAAMRKYYYYYYRSVQTAKAVSSYEMYASSSQAPVRHPQAAPEPSTQPQVSPVPSTQPQASPEPSTQPQASPEPSTQSQASPVPSTQTHATPAPSTQLQTHATPAPSTQPQTHATSAPSTQPQETPAPSTQPQTHATSAPSTQPQETPAPSTQPQETPKPVAQPQATQTPPTHPQTTPVPSTQPLVESTPAPAPSTQPQEVPTSAPAASSTSEPANSFAATPDTYPPPDANGSDDSGSGSGDDSRDGSDNYGNKDGDQQYRSLAAPTPNPSTPTPSPPPNGPVAEVVATSEVCLVKDEWKKYVKANEEALTEYNMPSSERDSFIKSIKTVPTKVGDYHCFRDQVQFDEMGQLVAAAFSSVSAAQMTERFAGDVQHWPAGRGHTTTRSNGGWSPETSPDGRNHRGGGGTASRAVTGQGSCDERAASCDASSWRYGCTSRRNCCCPSFCVGYFDLAFRYLRIAQSTRRRSTTSCCVSSFC
ncbi:hypothetical protein MMPV_001203 [Pyropia vietnamensis]